MIIIKYFLATLNFYLINLFNVKIIITFKSVWVNFIACKFPKAINIYFEKD